MINKSKILSKTIAVVGATTLLTGCASGEQEPSVAKPYLIIESVDRSGPELNEEISKKIAAELITPYPSAEQVGYEASCFNNIAGHVMSAENLNVSPETEESMVRTKFIVNGDTVKITADNVFGGALSPETVVLRGLYSNKGFVPGDQETRIRFEESGCRIPQDS